VTIVDPGAGIEIEYGGSLRPSWINGSGNGLAASKWHWEGEKSGTLVCLQSGCHAPGVTEGNAKIVGYEAQDLIQLR
jgi:hypothetical protein